MAIGWIEKHLDELFDFSGGLSASRADLSTKGYPYLHYGDIHGSTKTFVDVCADRSIPRLDVDLNKVSNASLLNDGDIVFVDASEDDEGASRHIVVRNANNLPFISGLHTIVAKAKTDELDNKFREYCFQTALIKSQFKFYAVGTKVTGISKTNIGKIILSYPKDKSEQRRIAAVLSDTDALIAAMEKLIAKKRAIKQGAMQELLTGKRRLSGFSEKWQEKKVSDFGVVVTGATPSTSVAEYWNGNIPWVTPTDISVAKDIFTTERMITECGLSAIRELPTNTLLITCIASIGKNTILKSIGASNQQINAIIPKANYNVDFLYYLFEINKSYLLGKAGQTATNIISKQDFSKFIFTVPCSLPEQTAIASILSDMDAEIDALTKKLSKIKQIKQGMMSELLTGRIRLTSAETLKFIAMPHNEQFDDAVAFAEIVDKFSHPIYTLGRVKMYKLLYLFRRHQEMSTSGFTKMAAGPYKSDARYNGGEKIAIDNGYIVETKGNEGFAISKGKNISAALNYSKEWQWQDAVKWLVSNFQHKTRDDLETLATVDMAVCELRETSKTIDLQSVKEIIRSNIEWKPKLSKPHFSDMNIILAIKRSKDLFG